MCSTSSSPTTTAAATQTKTPQYLTNPYLDKLKVGESGRNNLRIDLKSKPTTRVGVVTAPSTQPTK